MQRDSFPSGRSIRNGGVADISAGSPCLMPVSKCPLL
jgi:hypothetical protein